MTGSDLLPFFETVCDQAHAVNVSGRHSDDGFCMACCEVYCALNLLAFEVDRAEPES